jgi:hypothetical protein
LIDGTGDVDTYVVVGSWKSQRREQQASVSLEATSIMTANVEIGEAGVAKENNHWINTIQPQKSALWFFTGQYLTIRGGLLQVPSARVRGHRNE